MPEFFFDPIDGQLDFLFCLLCLFILMALVLLLLPTPDERRDSAPTEDTTKTRRLR